MCEVYVMCVRERERESESGGGVGGWTACRTSVVRCEGPSVCLLHSH